jgi:PAS domain S-box-containing protein
MGGRELLWPRGPARPGTRALHTDWRLDTIDIWQLFDEGAARFRQAARWEGASVGTTLTDLRILLVEDSPEDAELLLLELQQGGLELECERVDTLSETSAALQRGGWDVVLADYNLPGFTALDVLELMRSHRIDLPLIVVSGAIGEETAVQAMKAGVQDYVLKQNLSRLGATILREVEDARRNRRRDALLRESERRYRRIVDLANEGIWVLDDGARTTFVNERMASMLGYAYEEMVGKPVDAFLFEEDVADHRARFERRRLGVAEQYERRYRHKDGRTIWTLATASPLFEPDGRFLGSFGMYTDNTQRKGAEQALRDSERRLTDILNLLPDATFAVDARGAIVLWNQAAERLTGASAQSLLGKADREHGLALLGARRPMLVDVVLEPEELSRVAYTSVHREADGAIAGEGYVLTKGGQAYVSAIAAPLRDSAGKMVGAIESIRDISERKKMEEALQDSQRTLVAVIDSAPIPQFVIDRRHRVTSWNRALEELSHILADQVIGTDRHWAAFHPAKRPTLADLLVDEPESPPIAQWYEGMLTSSDPGDTYTAAGYFPAVSGGRWLQCTAKTIRDARGNVIGAAETIQDITERRQAEEERERHLASERAARREAERVGRMKDEFLATLSHEIRTPLNAILGWSQMLRAREGAAEGARRGLETIERNARAQAKLIDDMLDTSRIISGQLRLDVRPVDLQALIRTVADSLRPAAQAKSIRLEWSADSAPALRGDPARLQQVMWNLLSNAIKFTPRGGHVRIQARRAGAQVEMEVTDTGIGIRPEFMAHMFERFRQADASTTRRYGGLGLGLAIVRHLVELHGGTVQASSPGENRGATFRVRLPLESARSDEVPQGVPVLGEQPLGAVPQQDLSGVRVLVVDDEPDARELVSWVLDEQHASVRVAESAAAAFDLFRREVPTVVVSDIAMPQEDGYSLIRKVRSLPPDRGGSIPAIALTALALEKDRDRALGAGFQRHLAKPVDPETLVSCVAELAGVRSRQIV